MKRSYLALVLGTSVLFALPALARDGELEKRVEALERGSSETRTMIQALDAKTDAQAERAAATERAVGQAREEAAKAQASAAQAMEKLQATEARLAETNRNLGSTNEKLSATQESLASATQRVGALEGKVGKLEELLARSVGWDCAATCQIYKTFNGQYLLDKVETVAGHGLNAAEAMSQMTQACKTVLKATPTGKASQLVDEENRMASVKSSCAYSQPQRN